MTKKESSNIFGIFKNLLLSHAKRLVDLFYLANLEARLAGKTLVSLIVMAVLLLFLLSSTWLSLLFLIFFIFLYFNFSQLFAATIIFLLNLLMIGAIYIYVRIIRKNLTFPATRRQLANITLPRRKHE